MTTSHSFRLASMRFAAAGLLAFGALLPVAASAAPDPSTGTLVGTVTCGAAEDTPAANAAVAVEGLNIVTHTNSAGKFILSGVPGAQTFTIDALTDPTGAFVTSRYNVNVQPGQTLDIGSMDLAVCPPPASPALAPQDQVPADYQQDQDNGA
jgi:hypothetical protein